MEGSVEMLRIWEESEMHVRHRFFCDLHGISNKRCATADRTAGKNMILARLVWSTMIVHRMSQNDWSVSALSFAHGLRLVLSTYLLCDDLNTLFPST
jgi:hypothetical protein